MERVLRNRHVRKLADRIDDARWARSNAVDGVLAQLTNLSDADVRDGAVTAIGWRVRKRNASPDPLLKALRHKDGHGLGRGGPRPREAGGGDQRPARGRGLRGRREPARGGGPGLGALGDKRAADLLMRLANEPGHALQDAAAEALGRLGKAADTGEVLKLLHRYAEGRTPWPRPLSAGCAQAERPRRLGRHPPAGP